MKKITIILIISGIIVIGAATWGLIVSNVEQAKYDTIETQGSIEIRNYAPHIVAEVSVSGERKEAINQGFRLIADYIFGNNNTATKVAMTAPVIQQDNGSEWNIQFFMPASYTLATLPKPKNNNVSLHQIASKRYAAIRFSGIADSKSIKQQTDILNNFIAEKKLQVISTPILAFYNPPWTLPFFRRNEVMVEIAK